MKVFQKEHSLEVSAFESSHIWKGPVRNFIEHRFNEQEINKHCQDIIGLFGKSNQLGIISPPDVKKLKGIGQMLYDELLPLDTKQRLNSTQTEYLILDVDDKLNHLPWELLFDGNQFLCLKFSMGRIVRTSNDPQMLPHTSRKFTLPLKMLIMFDPQGNLASDYAGEEPTEGELILDSFARQDSLAADYKGSPIDSGYVKMHLRDYDIVHYAGHAEFDAHNPDQSGWLLSDRKLLATDIIKMLGDEKLLPALIFSNACQSGVTGNCKTANVYDLAKIFLLGGVQHYIGTFWDILNKPSAAFALAFYKELAQAKPVGEALKNARLNLIQTHGEEVIIWASYVLYGDPTINYLKIAATPEVERKSEATEPQPDIRRGASPAAVSSKRPSGRAATYLIGGGVILAALFAIALPQIYRNSENTTQPRPQAVYNHIVLGDAWFDQGNVEKAILEYTQAAESEGLPQHEKALAYSRLGRSYTGQGKYEPAIFSYNQAISYDNRNPELYSNKGMLLRKMGNYKAAMEQFDQALKLKPRDNLAALFKQETGQRIADVENSNRRERLDKLINELAEAYRQQKPAPAATEGKPSEKLTITFLDFKSRGDITNREGEDEYILLKMMDYLRDTGKVKVVERQLVEKLLDELKLGSSELVDPQVSVKLGRILAAKFIITGHIIRDRDNIQAGLRLIETETTVIKAAIAESMDKTLPPDKIAGKLAGEIIKRMKDEG